MRLKKIVTAFAAVALISTPVFFAAAVPVQAAVSDWQQGASMSPRWTEDFGSDSFRESLRNLRDVGATHVAFVVPYYQSNIYSTDISPGWNTPTDASLIAGIQYAHELGLAVMLKPHMETHDGQWRANINPSDREAWFAAYQNYLVHLGEIANIHGVEMISLGTEMVSMSASTMHPTNTENWVELIGAVRSVYSGALTYGANSNDNGTSPFLNEKRYIDFWSHLDYAGLSVYYSHNTPDDSVQSIKDSWNYWNNNDLRAFARDVGKPVLFLEIGYRSVDNSRQDPWDWQRGGSHDPWEQANAYEALLSYWNDYGYIHGVYWWQWSTDPNTGGEGNTDYTPQHKPAQAVLEKWYGNAPVPQPPQNEAAFSTEGSANPGGTTVGNPVTLQLMAETLGGQVGDTIIDIEVYDQANNRVFQQYYEGQDFGTGETRTYEVSWVPSASGTYRMAAGIFAPGWSKVYHWNNEAASITVTGGGTPPPGGGEDPPPSGPGALEVWWPTDGATVSGTQPVKVMLQGLPISNYRMYWQVGEGGRVEMYNSEEDYPHKESLIDYSGWNWLGSGPYKLTFTATDHSDATLAQRAVNIFVAQ